MHKEKASLQFPSVIAMWGLVVVFSVLLDYAVPVCFMVSPIPSLEL